MSSVAGVICVLRVKAVVYFQATFEAHFNDPGDFLVTVQSLPLPNKGYTQKIENVFTKTNYSMYPIQM